MDKLMEGRRVFNVEIEALSKTRDALDDTFANILEEITSCKGKLVITGMGKPGHIGEKMAATFASLGTPSFFLHPAEAMHGDLGMLSHDDVVIAISYSGESDEIIRIIPNIKLIGATLISITGNADSTLAKSSDVVQVLPEFDEACHLGLAPTSSTTAVLCYGDALAVAASKLYGFESYDFAKFHPAGSLGKKLILRVKDVMIHADDTAVVTKGTTLKDAIIAMSRLNLSIVTMIENRKIIGIFTDGDLRRLLEKGTDIYSINMEDVMTHTPILVRDDSMAVDALKIIREKKITLMPVINSKNEYCGVITTASIVEKGIV